MTLIKRDVPLNGKNYTVLAVNYLPGTGKDIVTTLALNPHLMPTNPEEHIERKSELKRLTGLTDTDEKKVFIIESLVYGDNAEQALNLYDYTQFVEEHLSESERMTANEAFNTFKNAINERIQTVKRNTNGGVTSQMNRIMSQIKGRAEGGHLYVVIDEEIHEVNKHELIELGYEVSPSAIEGEEKYTLLWGCEN